LTQKASDGPVTLADLTTERLVSKMDPEPFRINVLTSCFLERARIPITLPTDRAVIRAALETCWRIDPAQARMVVPWPARLWTVSVPVSASPHAARTDALDRAWALATDAMRVVSLVVYAAAER